VQGDARDLQASHRLTPSALPAPWPWRRDISSMPRRLPGPFHWIVLLATLDAITKFGTAIDWLVGNASDVLAQFWAWLGHLPGE
jgi:hypothetical protein